MTACLFVSDLHGDPDRYAKLFAAIEAERPAGVFLGGDLLPGLSAAVPAAGEGDFVGDVLAGNFRRLRDRLGDRYPRVFLILGNDDARCHEASMLASDGDGLWSYAHGRRIDFGEFSVYGYAFVPPTPFRLKDWERYDVSRFVDPWCVSPEEGTRSVPADAGDPRYATIQADLEGLPGVDDLGRAIFLFHAPPYRTNLDRAALDGRMIDHAPVDVHVGSIAVRRFIERRQPLVTLHGHVHESARLTGEWRDRIGGTVMLGAAHDGPELALVRFDPGRPGAAERSLI